MLQVLRRLYGKSSPTGSDVIVDSKRSESPVAAELSPPESGQPGFLSVNF